MRTIRWQGFRCPPQRMSSPDDLFMKLVEGRYKQSMDSISSARFWAPRFTADSEETGIPHVGDYVPRPDRNISTLWKYSLFGFLGLDHFYLRSPGTGIIKLLTLGGFLFWWLWDLIQISTEKERVLNYGLSTPFDFQTGIGQGMMYEGGRWNYKQITDFSSWSFATVFGFLGVDMFLLGRFWLGFRKLIIFLITISAIAPFISTLLTKGLWSAISSVGFFGLIWDIVCFMLAIGLFIIWMGDMSTMLTHPDTILKDGLPISQTAVDSLGWIKKLYMDDEGNVTPGLESEWKTIDEHYSFHAKGIVGQEMQGRFWIAHGDEKPKLPGQNTIPGIIPLQIFWRVIVNFLMWIVSGILFLWKMTPMGRASALAEQGLSAKGSSKWKGFSKAMDSLGAVQGLVNPVAPTVPTVSTPVDPRSLAGVKKFVGARDLLHTVPKIPAKASKTPVVKQHGGAESLSLESQVMGAVLLAILAGGSLKGVIDFTMTD